MFDRDITSERAASNGRSPCRARPGPRRLRGGGPWLAKGRVKDFDNRVTIQGDSLLNVADLAVTFDSQEGTVHAVDGVSFAIQPGETVGLVGESGCGKSISALAILGLVRMMSNSTISGRVEFMGRDLLALPESAVRSVRGRDMAMIFQDPVTSLNPVLSIERQMPRASRAISA